MNVGNEVLKRLLRTPQARAIERQIEGEHIAKRRQLETQITDLLQKRANAVEEAQPKLDAAKARKAQWHAEMDPVKDAVLAAGAAVERAKNLHYQDLKRLNAELAALPPIETDSQVAA